MAINKPKSILIITYGNFNHASTRIRALEYIPFFEAENWKVTWCARVPSSKNKLVFAILKRFFFIRLTVILIFKNIDVVFLQRYLLPKLLVKIIEFRKIKLIFDFDDAIHISHKLEISLMFERVIKQADLTLVSSEEFFPILENYKKRYLKVISPINYERFKFKENYSLTEKDKIKIVWIGSESTTKYLSLIINVLDELSKKYNIKLILIGSKSSLDFKSIEVEKMSWFDGIEYEELHKADIGIMPLFGDAWDKFKGGYKLYLYMGAGIPVIATPVGINEAIVSNGKNGFLANSSSEWKSALVELFESSDLRKKLGENGRKDAESKYSRRVTASQIIKIFKEFL